MIALEVYSDAIFYFRADISKKIAAIFLGVRQIAQQRRFIFSLYSFEK
jgi:hypothetical protein